ncbi:hypothetical protein F4804DRAFT_309671 [Jackrogersella minutella]|nr:hypothetical protein F4804DRAFT_309671 [Jackrogersella minutella]
MAIGSEKERAQYSSSAAYGRPDNEQPSRRPWMQVISSQNPAAVQDPRQQQPLPPLAHISNTTHETRVQWFACQLSKGTLRQYLNVITVPLPIPKNATRLELLPQNVINRICQYVPYENLIWLYQQSKALYRIIDPYLAPHETQLSLVLRAERDFIKHYTEKPPNLGCYMWCKRVLPAGVFASNQPLQALLRPSPLDVESVVNLRRFCIYCGIKSGCHNPGDELTTRAGGRFWLCNCLQILSDATSGCKDCRTLCPLTPRGPDKNASTWKSREEIWNIVSPDHVEKSLLDTLGYGSGNAVPNSRFPLPGLDQPTH